MKKLIGLIMALVLMCSTLAFAGGDQNQNQHDGDLGQGPTTQIRNK